MERFFCLHSLLMCVCMLYRIYIKYTLADSTHFMQYTLCTCMHKMQLKYMYNSYSFIRRKNKNKTTSKSIQKFIKFKTFITLDVERVCVWERRFLEVFQSHIHIILLLSYNFIVLVLFHQTKVAIDGVSILWNCYRGGRRFSAGL